MQQLKFYWKVVPAYHTEFGLATICLKACGTILLLRESICKDRRFFSTSEEAACIIFLYASPQKMELVQEKYQTIEVRIEYLFLGSTVHHPEKGIL